MLGTLLGIGSKIIGGILGQNAAEKDRRHAESREDSSIQRRVADSLKAGIHPAFGLGASVSSPAPVLTGHVAESFSEAGQDLGRAIEATKPPAGRALTTQAEALQLRRMGLENTFLEEQIRSERARRVGSPPAYPGAPPSLMEGQGDLRVRLPGGGEFVAGPTDYEKLEKLYGEPADLYGAMMMAKHATDSDANWSSTKNAVNTVGDQILYRLLKTDIDATRRYKEKFAKHREGVKRTAWMRRDPTGPSWRGRLPLTGRR